MSGDAHPNPIESEFPTSSFNDAPTFLADYEGRGERISIEPSAGIVMNPEAVPFAF
jgi:hypothetical protein